MKQKYFYRTGFTLIELLIALGISSIIFVVVSTVLASIMTANMKSRRMESFEQVKNSLAAEITGSVKWSETVNFTENSLAANERVYSLESGRIWKNGEPITPESVKINSFTISNYSTLIGLVGLEVNIEMEDANNALLKDSLKVVISQRKTTVEQGGEP